MGMTGPGTIRRRRTAPKKRPAWMVGGVTILSFVVLLYVIELFDSLSGHHLDNNGIRPLETDGLTGIIFAPLLHSNWDHLIANTDPGVDSRLPDDAGGAVPVHLRHRHHLDPRWLRHVADRQCRHALPLRRRALRDQPHRRLRADLRLAGVLDRVRVLHPQGVGDRRRGDRAVHLRRRAARRAARHPRGVVAGPLLRRGRRRDRRLPAVRARAEGPRSAQARALLYRRRTRRDVRHWRPSGSSIPASADSPSRGRSSTSCPTRTSSTSGTPATAPTVR